MIRRWLRDPRNLTLLWHAGMTLGHVVGIVGNLAMRSNYTETSKARADAAVSRHIHRSKP